MSFTLVLGILLCSVIILFSRDFAKIARKIWAIKGVKLWLPLGIASAIIIDYLPVFVCILDYVLNALNWCIRKFAAGLPLGSYSRMFAGLCVLMLIGFFLPAGWEEMRKRTGYCSFGYHQQAMIVLWTVTAMLYIYGMWSQTVVI